MGWLVRIKPFQVELRWSVRGYTESSKLSTQRVDHNCRGFRPVWQVWSNKSELLMWGGDSRGRLRGLAGSGFWDRVRLPITESETKERWRNREIERWRRGAKEGREKVKRMSKGKNKRESLRRGKRLARLGIVGNSLKPSPNTRITGVHACICIYTIQKY